MPSPTNIQVKISSEAVESIAMTPVVVQDMQLEELIEVVVSATGKDLERIREVLHRGGLVRGGSRFRWQGFEVTEGDVGSLLAKFPDPDPQRPFNAANCTHVLLRGRHSQVQIERAAAQKRRLFRARSFWDELLTLSAELKYAGYSYGEHADIYRALMSTERHRWLVDAARLSRYSSLSRQIESTALDSIDFFVKR